MRCTRNSLLSSASDTIRATVWYGTLLLLLHPTPPMIPDFWSQVELGKEIAAQVQCCDVELLTLDQPALEYLMSSMLVDMQVRRIHRSSRSSITQHALTALAATCRCACTLHAHCSLRVHALCTLHSPACMHYAHTARRATQQVLRPLARRRAPSQPLRGGRQRVLESLQSGMEVQVGPIQPLTVKFNNRCKTVSNIEFCSIADRGNQSPTRRLSQPPTPHRVAGSSLGTLTSGAGSAPPFPEPAARPIGLARPSDPGRGVGAAQACAATQPPPTIASSGTPPPESPRAGNNQLVSRADGSQLAQLAPGGIIVSCRCCASGPSSPPHGGGGGDWGSLGRGRVRLAWAEPSRRCGRWRAEPGLPGEACAL